jgi:uncharacterized protein (DUF1015 family)
VAPPYDVINLGMREALYQKSPYNIVRLILNRDPDPYKAAATYLSQWISGRILVRDPEPCIYFTEERFPHPAGGAVTRRGFVALCLLEDFSSGRILPHEKTLSPPKEDRLHLIRACRANLSPIFGLYSSPELRISQVAAPIYSKPPVLSFVDDLGTEHRLWKVVESDLLSGICEGMDRHSILIADGHHRYEAALGYRDLMRQEEHTGEDEAPYEFTMMGFFNTSEAGIVILPFHRLIRGIPVVDASQVLGQIRSRYEVRELPIPEEEGWDFLKVLRGSAFGFVLQGMEKMFLVRTRTVPDGSPLDRLAVVELTRQVFHGIFGLNESDQAQGEKIHFTQDPTEALQGVRLGGYQAAFFLNPPAIEEIWQVCLSGERMPQKSTYFYPKLSSGLTINPLVF